MGIRTTTAGESHGRALVAVIEGIPFGVPLAAADIDKDLARRQQGYGRGGRQAIEADRALIVSGVRSGTTLGTPIALTVANRDWDNWVDVMSVDGEPAEPVTRPRPGHADLAGVQKIGSPDVRDVLERASARETAARVAAGGVCRALLGALVVTVRSYVAAIGEAALPDDFDDDAVDWEHVASSPVSCPDPAVSERMTAVIDAARERGDTVGGRIVVLADGLVPGLGGYATAAERLDGRLAQGLMSIPAIKAVELGLGRAYAWTPGSAAHDEIVPGKSAPGRASNRAGGLEGGMTNGQRLRVAATMKPIPTLMDPLSTVDLSTGKATQASTERSDVCAVPAAAVVCEAEACRVLADAHVRKFGGDSLEDLSAALAAYERRIGWVR
jgi:chorismate synthase